VKNDVARANRKCTKEQKFWFRVASFVGASWKTTQRTQVSSTVEFA